MSYVRLTPCMSPHVSVSRHILATPRQLLHTRHPPARTDVHAPQDIPNPSCPNTEIPPTLQPQITLCECTYSYHVSFVMQRNKEQRLQLPNVASYEHRPLHARQDIRPGRPHNPTQGEGRMRDTSSPRPATEREKNGTNTYNMPTPCM